MTQPVKQNPVRSFFGSLSGADQLRAEKDRLEAFLAAMPGEYCGFSPDGSVIYSTDFLTLMGLNQLENIYDVQNALNLGDSAILEGLFNRLQEDGKEFTIDVSNNSGQKHFNISGSRGCATSGNDWFDILWLKDTTNDTNNASVHEKKNKEFENKIQNLQHSLNALPTPAWIRGSDGNITWCNTDYAATVESSLNEIVKTQKEISFKSKDAKIKSIKDLTKKVQKNNSQQRVNGHIICCGKRHFVEITESPLQDSSDIFGIIRNLNREEELDNELQRHLSANKTLLEQLRSAIALFNADQELEFFNSSFAELWGLEEQWLNNRPKLGDILEKLRETRRLPEQADFRNYKKTWLDMFTRLIDPHEDMMYLPDDSALRMLVVPHPMGGLMMTFEDVTSRLELESSYNTLIAVQKETLDNLAEGVAVYGGDGRLKLSNLLLLNSGA